jgi:hypothetical protein
VRMGGILTLRSSLVTCFSSMFLTLSLTSLGLSIFVLMVWLFSAPAPILNVLYLLGAARAALLPPLARPPLSATTLSVASLLLPLKFPAETGLLATGLLSSEYLLSPP